MIYDRLTNSKKYYALGKNIQKGFEFLLSSDLKNMADGRYSIDGDKIYANIQSLKTKPIEDRKWEAHRKYIDIQYVIKGEEKMGYGILDDFNKIIEEYDSERDITFLDTDKNNYNFIGVKAGDFVIFYPDDVHAPMLAYDKPEEIKKVIVKIALD